MRFIRYEVGAGIEKKQENFADEVMAQRARRLRPGPSPRIDTRNPARAGFLIMASPSRGHGTPDGIERSTTAAHDHAGILVKLSGEALMGEADYGIDPAFLKRLASEIVAVCAPRRSRSRSWSAAATCSAARVSRAPAWTASPATTWACSPRS